MVKCNLSKEINNCPFCDIDKMECKNNDTKCSFRIDDKEDIAERTRKEKWYEKYYKNSKPVRSKE